jgi:DNA-directed RNA polymerase subunit RPC12/RpoP
VEDMGLKRILAGNWFTRVVLISWIVCAISIFIAFKNMELIVHGQLYSYGLIFSEEWAGSYRFFTWMIFLSLGVPTALSGAALVSSFFKVEQVSEKKVAVPQNLKPMPVGAKVERQLIVKETAKSIENGDGISCPNCKKVFGKALVMLDFHGGKNQLVSVCPYCNHILGNTSEAKCANEDFHVAPYKKIER